MRKIVLLAICAASTLSLKAEYQPEAWNLAARQKFADQRFGIFIHWGLYANYAQGEWEHAHHQGDGSWKRTLDWDFDTIYDFIHSKHVLVANNNHQPIRAKEDIQLFERDLPGEGTAFSKNGEAIYATRGLGLKKNADGTETAKTKKGDTIYTITIKAGAFPVVIQD